MEARQKNDLVLELCWLSRVLPFRLVTAEDTLHEEKLFHNFILNHWFGGDWVPGDSCPGTGPEPAGGRGIDDGSLRLPDVRSAARSLRQPGAPLPPDGPVDGPG